MENDFTAAQTIVVKVGTTSLTHDNGTIDLRKMDALARVLTDLENEGRKIVLVSSGAIGCGMHRLKMSQRPITLEEKQMTASVGQGLLMELYHRSFDSYYQNIGQILLTKDVFSNPIKRINARNTFSELMKRRIIPIVNENDPISTDEIEEERFGDNDRLSAMTAALIEADGLIILSDVDGLYTGDPGKEAQAQRIDIVEKVTEKIMKLGGVSGSSLGTGGMVTKLKAARYAANHGLETIITSGSDVNVLYRIMDGEPIGTLFRKNQKFYQVKEQEVKNV
ncbi:glutamate 5-kinase [Pseudoramibacter alactolyticus ATCC 23263]|uniref:Glutamate 5-kinase n=1 Tax=Pseudoramibacter alactolyticus ATCC 23263 TaxID=887929 RepID=E6MFR1_9FIRM|nr:glutamate 5-kinase [Pseudoramibacter alactolyticus]EFV02056.1 glutamate 5-kinase [Pseudoramibacter alactolyticus ATCC 23263]